MAESLRDAGILSTLRMAYFFSGLPEEDLKKIASVIQIKSLEKGAYLFRQGEPSTGFYIVRSGVINVHRLGTNGREQVIHLFRAGESFAEAALCDEGGYPAEARASSKAEVILVPKRQMLDFVAKKPEFALRMLGSMALHLRTLVNAVDDLTLKDLEARFVQWLLKHCPKPYRDKAVTFDIGVSKTVLAAELSTRHETLSRTLAKFKSEKRIAIKGRMVTVLSPVRLAKILGVE